MGQKLDRSEWDFREFKPAHLCNSAKAWGCLFYEVARELPAICGTVAEIRESRGRMEATREESAKREAAGRRTSQDHLQAMCAHTRAMMKLQALRRDRRCSLAAFVNVEGFPKRAWLSFDPSERKEIDPAALVMKWGDHNPDTLRMAEAKNPAVHVPLLVVVNPHRGRKEIEASVTEGLRKLFGDLEIKKQSPKPTAYHLLRDLGLTRLRARLGLDRAKVVADDAGTKPCDDSDWVSSSRSRRETG